MPISLPELPYALDALAPHMSERTLQFHHGKHHKSYVDKANGLIEGTPHEGKELYEIVVAAARDKDTALFNNAAQAWNHSFFWQCMTPNGGGAPEGETMDAIENAFGGLDGFKKEFREKATGQFGSGWAWLVLRDGTLEVTSTSNAETPIVSGLQPVLTCDVWEHAYYLDYQNERPKFVDAFLDNLVNWNFVAEQLAASESTEKRRGVG
ncbi:MAG: superoxide dismutase [Alphaproteobacteria bacterium]